MGRLSAVGLTALMAATMAAGGASSATAATLTRVESPQPDQVVGNGRVQLVAVACGARRSARVGVAQRHAPLAPLEGRLPGDVRLGRGLRRGVNHLHVGPEATPTSTASGSSSPAGTPPCSRSATSMSAATVAGPRRREHGAEDHGARVGQRPPRRTRSSRRGAATSGGSAPTTSCARAETGSSSSRTARIAPGERPSTTWSA